MSDGSKTSYYNIKPNKDEYVDVDQIALELNLTFAEANIIKAIFGIAIARKTGLTRHKGTSKNRDISKAIHYCSQLK
jgi:hypothetical protein